MNFKLISKVVHRVKSLLSSKLNRQYVLTGFRSKSWTVKLTTNLHVSWHVLTVRDRNINIENWIVLKIFAKF